MDDTKRVAPPDAAVLPETTVSAARQLVLSDGYAAAGAVRWLAEHYLMSDAFARILLGQLARQDGVTESAAARSVLATAVVKGSTPTSTSYQTAF